MIYLFTSEDLKDVLVNTFGCCIWETLKTIPLEPQEDDNELLNKYNSILDEIDLMLYCNDFIENATARKKKAR